MTAKRKCSKRVWRHIHWYPCSRPATVEHDGKWYCWQHDPERVAEEAVEQQAAREAKMDRETAKYAHIARNARLGKLVTLELAKLLEQLARNTWDCRSDIPGVMTQYNRDARAARTLAAHIREALEVNDEN